MLRKRNMHKMKIETCNKKFEATNRSIITEILCEGHFLLESIYNGDYEGQILSVQDCSRNLWSNQKIP